MSYEDWDPYLSVLKNAFSNMDISIVSYVDFGGSYEWDTAVVYRAKSDSRDVYYVGEGSGCSCNSYGDYAGLDDLMEFSSRRSLLSYLRNSSSDKLKSLHSDVLASR